MSESPYRIYWLLAEKTPASLCEAGAFLSPQECQKLSAMRFPKRRDAWLLGRWAAKSLIHNLPDYQNHSMPEIEIKNTPEGVPVICLPGGRTSPDCLSISHSGPLAFCALTQAPALMVGVDLEKIEPRSEDFIQDYFTPGEQRLVGSFPLEAKHAAVTLIWSMKEAMLKAIGVGLRWDTRQVEIREIRNENYGDWQEVIVSDLRQKNRPWTAWWQRRGDFLMTIAGFTEHPGPLSVLLIEQHA